MKTQSRLLKKTFDTARVVLFLFVIALCGGITGALVVQFITEVAR